jgi:hypothetical protein
LGQFNKNHLTVIEFRITKKLSDFLYRFDDNYDSFRGGGEVVASNDLDSKFLIPKLFVFDQVIINIVAQSFLGGIGDCEKS